MGVLESEKLSNGGASAVYIVRLYLNSVGKLRKKINRLAFRNAALVSYFLVAFWATLVSCYEDFTFFLVLF
ncbi:hypothetical protein A7J08_09525 [Streptococcus suis]|uniref:F5/8 type C domain-containing protein n=1 Tax=Streptococcus suis TaxID=1307 RepID=A0A3Q8BDF8_STRSU|nr:hypothetical protein A7J08_09265 [Streptococcus suis]